METIKEFLRDNTASNLNVIITAIISAILTTFIITVSKLMWNKLKTVYNEINNFTKNNKNRLKSTITSRKSFEKFYKEYKKDKSLYTLEREVEFILSSEYLTKKQKRIVEMIRKENKDEVGKQFKEISDNMKRTIDLNQEYFNVRFQKNPWE